MQPHHLDRILAGAPPACRPDNEEVAHDTDISGQPANEGEAHEGLVAVSQITASVGISEEAQQPRSFVAAAAVEHVAPELRGRGDLVTLTGACSCSMIRQFARISCHRPRGQSCCALINGQAQERGR
jgi:hypothetical protein